MKRVDHSVSETDAKAYVHNIITEHSLSPAWNNWVIVPAQLGIYEDNLRYQNWHTENLIQVFLKPLFFSNRDIARLPSVLLIISKDKAKL